MWLRPLFTRREKGNTGSDVPNTIKRSPEGKSEADCSKEISGIGSHDNEDTEEESKEDQKKIAERTTSFDTGF